MVGFIEEVEHQSAGLVEGKDLQFVGILEVHDLIADVVSRLDEVDQRIAGPSVGSRLRDAELVGQRLIGRSLRGKEPELVLLATLRGREGILDNRGQRRVGHREATLPTALEAMREQSEGIGIAVEVGDVGPEVLADLMLKMATLALGEEGLDGLLARVAEGRIAHVVSQTGRGHDLPHLRGERIDETAVF